MRKPLGKGKAPPAWLRGRSPKVWIAKRARGQRVEGYEVTIMDLPAPPGGGEATMLHEIVDKPEALRAADEAKRSLEGMKARIEAMTSGGRRSEAKRVYRLMRENLRQYLEARARTARWDKAAISMPKQYASAGVQRKIMNRLRRVVRGNVLEAGCGATTYVREGRGVRKIVGLDGSRLMLQLYPGGRPRILFDLNEVARGKPLPFRRGEFNTAVLPFTYVYLKDPVAVFREFHRVIAPGGRIVIVEIPGAPDFSAYYEIGGPGPSRMFAPNRAKAELEQAGFRETRADFLSRSAGKNREGRIQWQTLTLTRP